MLKRHRASRHSHTTPHHTARAFISQCDCVHPNCLLCLVFILICCSVCACVKTKVPIGSLLRSYLSVDDERQVLKRMHKACVCSVLCNLWLDGLNFFLHNFIHFQFIFFLTSALYNDDVVFAFIPMVLCPFSCL